MNPWLALALLGGLYVAPKVLRRKKGLTTPLQQFALCGAHWDQGYASIPYEVDGLWYCMFRTGDGAAFADSRNDVLGASSKEDARIDGWAWLKDRVSRTGIPDAPSKPWLRVYGGGVMPPEVDSSFCTNIATNRIWADPKCYMIVEGAGFEPGSLDQFGISAVEAPSLAETMAIPGNSVYGYVDYLLKHGVQSALAIATRVLTELGCSEQYLLNDEDSWNVATWWRDDFARRISSYVEDGGGIPFNPVG